ncbi:class I SAM-dependent methyltransferase [Anaeromassilibacillus senegalensis]|uniref:class I SAM-dependent methyltransferase n=1 Tax=Anaeromassilibacillus senegalensis TaxID=1673717 RepID=UPI0006811DA3|nr:class I SAM-dependent methyltransferase [Anaeromassilibacillus senegalensis]
MPHPLFSLGARLALCASMVRPGVKLADIGTDHAYLPIWLARQGMISRAIAADVRLDPLRSAERNIRKYHVEDTVSARLSDGLSVIFPHEADDIVMAGMGGELMIRLIETAPWLKNEEKRLILQPMTSAEDLRRSLEREGYAVLQEKAVEEDGHVYSVMQAMYDPAQAGGGPLYPYIGKLQADTEAARTYIAKCAARLSKKADGMAISGQVQTAAQLREVLHGLNALLDQSKGGSQ